MGYKQPRVPEYRRGDGEGNSIRALILFLKDFALSTWKEIETIKKRLDALEGK